jgi:hypothetical protein
VTRQQVEVRADTSEQIRMSIHREVPTPGLVAADSHIHTLTFSKHGDAGVLERVVSIAGEGVELAIATDHNHNTDYAPSAVEAGVSEEFTSVVGNEVTTPVGHFNIFPVMDRSMLPNHALTNWQELFRNVREVTTAKVIVLNHPRDTHSNYNPFSPANFNSLTGERYESPIFGCDALEVVTTAALQSDIYQVYRDWFALLNFGMKISAVGASDTHDVSRLIVGQSRTYVACTDTDPNRIDLDAVCDSYRNGRLWVSMGLLADLTVDSRFKVGDLATGVGAKLKVSVKVSGPSWAAADRVELFANGIKIRESMITPSAKIEKANISWEIVTPRHDVHLVVIATGPGITAPYWATPRPYQPTSRSFNPRVIASTNPVWVDADGDGRFLAPADYARMLLKRHQKSLPDIIKALNRFDEAVAIQTALACDRAGLKLQDAAGELKSASEQVQRGFAAYMSGRERPFR